MKSSNTSVEPDETRFEPSEADLTIDRCTAALSELKQILRFKAAVEAVGVPWENVLGPKRSAVYGQVIGIWLIKRDYATKQRDHPSDYRQFERPISLSEAAERRIFS